MNLKLGVIVCVDRMRNRSERMALKWNQDADKKMKKCLKRKEKEGKTQSNNRDREWAFEADVRKTLIDRRFIVQASASIELIDRMDSKRSRRRRRMGKRM